MIREKLLDLTFSSPFFIIFYFISIHYIIEFSIFFMCIVSLCLLPHIDIYIFVARIIASLLEAILYIFVSYFVSLGSFTSLLIPCCSIENQRDSGIL